MENKSRLPALVDWIDAPLRTAELLRGVERSVEALARNTESIPWEQILVEGDRRAQRLEQKIDALEAKTEALTVLADRHYTQVVLNPLAERVFTILDVLDQDASVESDLLEGVSKSLEDLLAHLGVTPFRSQTGAEFIARAQKPVKVIRTQNAELEGRVARSLRPGYRRSNTVIRPESVSVYRHDPLRKGAAA